MCQRALAQGTGAFYNIDMDATNETKRAAARHESMYPCCVGGRARLAWDASVSSMTRYTVEALRVSVYFEAQEILWAAQEEV